MEEVKRKRGRPRKVQVVAPVVEASNPIDQQLPLQAVSSLSEMWVLGCWGQRSSTSE